MWIILAFISSILQGVYDIFKKKSLRGNSILPVLLLNTMISCLLTLPFMWMTELGLIGHNSLFYCEPCTPVQHLYIVLKSCIILLSWLFGYLGIKNLPLTIVGPINATRPMIVVLCAVFIYGEQMNLWQWAGVILAIIGLRMLTQNKGKKTEGSLWKQNKWLIFTIISTLLGCFTELYDKYLLASPANGGLGLDQVAVQVWTLYNQFFIMAVVFTIWWVPRHKQHDWEWRWSIPAVSVVLLVADFSYFYALTMDGAMISIVSMIRRSSAIITFTYGVLYMGETCTKKRIIDVALIVVSMILFYIGTN